MSPDMEIFELPNGWHLRVHPEAKCSGEWCVIHAPMPTYNRRNLIWRTDRGIFEVVCDHGTGHPAPEQYGFWRKIDKEYEGIHGCDGCCAEWEVRND